LARARWYVDADTLGLARLLIQVRRDVTFPGDDGLRTDPRWNLPPCVIEHPDTDDDVWIPRVTRERLAIITRDKHIELKTAEKDAVVAARGRMFAITSDEKLNNWGLVEIVATQWREMERASEEPGPFIYSMTRTTHRKIDLW
jgi:hypothetical protein